MKLSIQKKILLLTISILILAVSTFAALSIYMIMSQGKEDIAKYRSESLANVRNTLMAYVDLAHATIENGFNKISDRKYQQQKYGEHLKSVVSMAVSIINKRNQQFLSGQLTLRAAQSLAAEDIKALRFNGGSGYLWINDATLPYPKMIMHPTVPALDGKTLDDDKFNCAMGKNQNLFQAAVEVATRNHEGFINYKWDKPTDKGVIPDVEKLSYVVHYKSWDWIIGTGIYIDDIKKDVVNEILQEISAMRYDSSNGYFWINDLQLPYPTMVLHPLETSLNSKVLDDARFDCVIGTNQNFFQAIAETSRSAGFGFVEYKWKNPKTLKIESKLSFFRKFEPLNWAVATGVYINNIEDVIQKKGQEIDRKINLTAIIILAIGVCLILAGSLASYYFSHSLIGAISAVKLSLENLSKGYSIEKLKIARSDELGVMVQSLNALVAGINSYKYFANEIAKGNLSAEFQLLSDNDSLGNSLLLMRSSLQKIATAERERAWHNDGITKSLEILQKNTGDLDQLCEKIISFLVRYIDANQGCFYTNEVDSEGNAELILKGTFAFDRKKFIENSIPRGHGLLGQAVRDKETLYMTDVPKNYVKITSGLGEANPTAVIIVPLMSGDEAVGCLELAFFRKLQEFEINFLKKVSENIGVTILDVKRNEKTKRLLVESQKMAEQLRLREEELKQNSEELIATQESMIRRLNETENSRAGNDQLATSAPHTKDRYGCIQSHDQRH